MKYFIYTTLIIIVVLSSLKLHANERCNEACQNDILIDNYPTEK